MHTDSDATAVELMALPASRHNDPKPDDRNGRKAKPLNSIPQVRSLIEFGWWRTDRRVSCIVLRSQTLYEKGEDL